MSAGEMADELNAINDQSPDLARVILQASVAALVNGQSVLAIERELRVRAAAKN